MSAPQIPSSERRPPLEPHPLAQPSRLAGIFSFRWLFGLAILVFILDRLSKAWIVSRLAVGSYGDDGISIIPNFLYIVHVGNTGAAWSVLSGRSSLLALLAVATLASIFIWRRELGLFERPAQVSFGLLCGGILGNLVDRIRYEHVIDFLDFHFGNYVYPTFNIADCGICIGVALYLINSFRKPARR